MMFMANQTPGSSEFIENLKSLTVGPPKKSQHWKPEGSVARTSQLDLPSQEPTRELPVPGYDIDVFQATGMKLTPRMRTNRAQSEPARSLHEETDTYYSGIESSNSSTVGRHHHLQRFLADDLEMAQGEKKSQKHQADLNQETLFEEISDHNSGPMARKPRHSRPRLKESSTKEPENPDAASNGDSREIKAEEESLAGSYVHGMDKRRKERQSRSKPWSDRPPKLMPRNAKGTIIQTHYDSYIPNDAWLQKNRSKYVKNHKYGNSYQLKLKKGKPFKPEQEEWLSDNDYRIWLLEKGKNAKGLNLNDVLGPSGGGGSEGRRGSKRPPGGFNIFDTPNYDSIGPHKDFIAMYKESEMEHESKESSAIELQRYVRGWLLRTSMKTLQTRALMLHASSWSKFLKYYKGVLTRVQKRYGIKFPSTPFNIRAVNTFLQRKEKYESVFKDMSSENKMSKPLLKAFFSECGYDPEEKEINIAYKAALRGCGAKAELCFVLDCSSSLGEENFGIQTEFIREMINALHIGPENVRVGYVPYNTDVFEVFGLDRYDNRFDLVTGIEAVKYRKGITRTDLALKKMREILAKGRKDIPRVAILITDGGSYASYATEKQSDLARKDKIQVFAVGVGNNVERKEIFTIATDRDHVQFVENYYSLSKVKMEILKKARFVNCQYCEMMAPKDMETGETRGLFLEEVLEIMWMLYPPEGAGIDMSNREATISRLVADIGEYDDADDDVELETCLKFVIKSKLEKNGIMLVPKANGRGFEEVGTWPEALDKAKDVVKRQRQEAKHVPEPASSHPVHEGLEDGENPTKTS